MRVNDWGHKYSYTNSHTDVKNLVIEVHQDASITLIELNIFLYEQQRIEKFTIL